MIDALRALLALAVLGISSAAFAADVVRDPHVVLQAAKAASGGAAWDALRTQHSKVTLRAGGTSGAIERWSDIATGRSYLSYDFGSVKGTQGFDGTQAWSQDGSGGSRIEDSKAARELAVNAAYRDRLAMWYPPRGKAAIAYKERADADGATFDVVRIAPEGGREYELWVNIDTLLIERMVEPEDGRTRTEVYMDFRDVAGVKIPFRVRASRGDSRYDDVVVVDSIAFNEPLSGVSFERPAAPAPAPVEAPKPRPKPEASRVPPRGKS